MIDRQDFLNGGGARDRPMEEFVEKPEPSRVLEPDTIMSRSIGSRIFRLVHSGEIASREGQWVYSIDDADGTTLLRRKFESDAMAIANFEEWSSWIVEPEQDRLLVDQSSGQSGKRIPIRHATIVVITCNEEDWLRKTVDSLLNNTKGIDFDIIVVSDGCTNDSWHFLKGSFHPKVRLLRNETPLGVSGARNTGGFAAEGDMIIFTDSHMLVETSNWLAELAECLRNPKVGGATVTMGIAEKPGLYPEFFYMMADHKMEPNWTPPYLPKGIQYTPALPGACFAVRREVFHETGGFDDRMKKWGREDLEYSIRLWLRGYPLVFSPRGQLNHAFDRGNRTFSVDWEQVGFNALRGAAKIFDDRGFYLVDLQHHIDNPTLLDTIHKHLLADEDLWLERDDHLAHQKMSFNAYLSRFQSKIRAYDGYIP